MALDNNPRDDNLDDESWPEMPGYQLMNVVNDDNGVDSDFEEFTSDEEDANEAGRNGRADRYANYELIGQGNDNGIDVTGQQALDDEESSDDGENNGNRLYQHNFVVQWIETDEPLFDRQEFEARQARQQQNQPNDNESDCPNNDQQRESPNEEVPQNNEPSSSAHSSTNPPRPKEHVQMDKSERISSCDTNFYNFFPCREN